MTTTRPPKNQKVLLTGIGGYLGAHIGRQLLEGGYTVVGSVSSLQKRYPHLDAWLHEFGPALDLQQADLLSPYEFEKIFAEHPDIEFVIHTASPYGVKKTAGKSAEELYMRPAKEGTLNVLRAAAGIVSAKGKEELSSTDELTASRDSSIASTQASTTPPPVGSAARPTRVRKVVFTSTMGAVANSFLPGKTYTEADWNDVDNDNYQAGKTAAEKAAHAFVQDFAKTFAKKCPFDLVTLCPFAIWGPSISQTTDNASAELFKGLLRGVPPFVMDLSLGVSDVRDVARAHVLALESEMASGRYLCCGEVVHVKKDILDKVRGLLVCWCRGGTILSRAGRMFLNRGIRMAR